MLTILGWLWKDELCKAQYTVRHANVWARSIDRNLTLPHRFVLATDYPEDQWHEFDPLIKPIVLWNDWRSVRNPTWPAHKPQCYVRLKAFSEEARELIGPRFVSIDLDVLVMGNLDGILGRTEDFLIYHRHNSNSHETVNTYQASMWMMTAGARKQVWQDFTGEASAKAAAQFMGSDQAWIRYKLGPDEPGWTDKDGVYSFVSHIKANPMRFARLAPEKARLIFFQGNDKPWDFGRDDVPRCQHCREPITINPPWALVRRGGPARPNYFDWIGKAWG